MESFFQTQFTVRRYECDLYGHVNNAIYLRYLQEAADRLICSDAVQTCQPGNYTFSPKQIEIEYLTPLKYGERVEVRLDPYCSQTGELFLNAELVRMKPEEVAARAQVLAAVHPVGIEQAEVFPGNLFPDISAEQNDFSPFPNPPAPPPGTYRMRTHVRWEDTNADQQVDSAILSNYIEACGYRVIAAHGWPVERMLAEGMAILLRRNQIEILHPISFGDELEIATWFSAVKRVTALRHYSIVKLGETLFDRIEVARVHSLGVWVDLKSGHPVRIPTQMLVDFSPNRSTEDWP